MDELNNKIQNRRTDYTTPSQSKPQDSNKNVQATNVKPVQWKC